MNLAVVGAAAVAGALMLALAGPGLLRLFGKDFSGGYTILLIMLGAAIPQALALAILQHLQSQERMWFSFFAVILPRDLLLVGLAYVWIPRSGAFGLAGACGLAWTVSLLAAVGVTSRAGLRTARVLTP